MKWIPSIITVVVAAATAFAPQLQHLVGSHKDISDIVIGLYAILGHMLPSPLAKGA